MGYISHFLTHLLEQYGYGVLFSSLFVEMLALPLPGEFIMTYAGLIVYQGNLNWLMSILVGWIGTSLGMTLSYWIGYRLGNPFFEKYGARFHFGPDKLNGVSKWFGRYGNKMLIIAYFIPGVRHITGYFSGTTRISFRKYAVYAFSGAFLWVSIFITLGKLLGPKWNQYHHTINLYMIIIGVISAAAYLLISFYKKNRLRIQNRILTLLDKSLQQYRSVGKVKFIILAAATLFVVFFSIAIGLIQDFLAHEFSQFDEISAYIVGQVFDSSWADAMNLWTYLGSYTMMWPLIILTAVWIGYTGKDRLLEIAFYAMVLFGGEGLDEGLRRLFHRSGPVGHPFTFPSEQALITLTVYGFTAYLLVRHHGKYKNRIIAVLAVSILSLLAGISVIYLGIEYPSDVIAGYVFGGLWISLNVVLLEIFRVMKSNRAGPRTKFAF
ncbi:bifunctional DedA family/phosphatase PAP2 family protein [Cohnella nanjingensis]|uniref:Bifunctional DedA family/phosphatase PAP2 family protein n=1 Tax=Cohnella nanjingensis TaxID=1387779 RepID=A0A7X0VE91_9BACL|nr:bifunctional DedA family/phosphatase PAP2 family protein [Cohnella nanjingensis]MBB6669309.1 bifunctional DedA family/phosphatase PAP2 family protein [Cohnella nanjingensis]